MLLYQIEESLRDKRKVAALLREAETENNPVDTATMDIPLLIRLLEYAREDAHTDMDLHDAVERVTKLSTSNRTLTMSDYDSIVKAGPVDV